jgi:L-asparaginase II
MSTDALLAEYVRDGVVESTHRGYLLALNADGSIHRQLGDVDTLIYPRSTIKSIQASAMVRNGLELEPRLLALAASSHSGAQMHLDGVREILALAGLSESALQCSLDRPLGDVERKAWGDKEATRITMNCSGKHAAMLLTCVKNNWPIENYLDPAHPLQVACKAELESLAGETITLTSTDGCGAPLFLLTVVGLARAIRAITISADPIHQSVISACRTHPLMVAGNARLTTEMMQSVPGLFMKDGAEAVNVASLADGRTLAIKISDGTARAMPAITAAALAKFGIDAHEVPVNVLGAGLPVGTIRATL